MVLRIDDLSLRDDTETLYFCRQKLIEHKSALRTVPGEDGEVDVRMNVYRPNPEGVRFVSACPVEEIAQARRRGTPFKAERPECVSDTVKVDVVKLAELGLLESASIP